VTGRQRATPRHRRVTPRSVLADELELPSREELSIGLDQAGLKPWPRWPLALIGGLFLLGIGSALALRGRSSAGSVQPAADGTASSGPTAGVIAVTPSVTSNAIGHEQPARPVVSAVPEPVASPVLPKPQRRAPERPSPAAPGAAQASPARKKPPVLGAPEIVDPWAK
jgi:hypothetical protein